MIYTDMPSYVEQATNIIALVLVILLIIGLLVLGVYWAMQTIQTEKAKADYVKTLNEHDRSLIAYYDNIKVNPWRKKHDISKD